MTIIYYKPQAVVGPSVIYYKSTPPSTPLSKLSPGASLSPGDSLVSPNGVYRFTLQSDGNLVLYKNLTPLWDSATVGQGGQRLEMQSTDGNLVLYDANGIARWATMTQGRPGAFFQVQDDGNAVVYDSTGNALWDTRTWGGAYHEDSGSWLSEAVKTVGRPFAALSHSLSDAWTSIKDAVGSLPVIGPGLHGLLVISAGPFEMTNAIVQGERIDKAVIADFRDKITAVREVAPYAQTVISFVPGIGQGVSAAMGASLALAQGAPIDEAILRAVQDSIPGGPLARATFSIAVAAAYGENLLQSAASAGIESLGLPPEATQGLRKALNVVYKAAQGDNIPMAALEEARDYLPSPEAKKAFDVAVALGHGKRLQDVLVNEVGSIAPEQIAKIRQIGQDAITSNRSLQSVYNGVVTAANRASVYGRTAKDGYELGVGFMRTAGTNESILNTARAQMTPSEQQGFDMAVAAHRTAVTTHVPPAAPIEETAAYVVAKGMAGNPNPMVKTDAVKMFLVSPNATIGLTRAIEQTRPKRSFWRWLKGLFHV